VQLTLPRRYWQTRWARPRIPCHPGRVTKSLFATSSGVPERHEDVISDGGFPRPPPPPPPRPRPYSFKSRSHREARSISRRAAPVQAKPGASFVSGSHLQAGRGAARRGAGMGGGGGGGGQRRRTNKGEKLVCRADLQRRDQQTRRKSSFGRPHFATPRDRKNAGRAIARKNDVRSRIALC